MWGVDDCFVHGCVNSICQLFLQNVWFLSILVLIFSFLWEISFSGQMISGTLNWLLALDRIIK